MYPLPVTAILSCRQPVTAVSYRQPTDIQIKHRWGTQPQIQPIKKRRRRQKTGNKRTDKFIQKKNRNLLTHKLRKISIETLPAQIL